MFPKASHALAFVGAVLVFVVLVFGADEQPVGISNAVEAAQNSAQQRAAREGGQAVANEIDPDTDAAAFDEFNTGPVGFDDFEIQQYGAPQIDVAPRKVAARASGPSARRTDLPQGPPPPGMRDFAKAPPRIIPKDPSSDPDLQADLDAALKR